MAVLSVLRVARSAVPLLSRRPAQTGQLCSVRHSEHMNITPSRFSWNLYKDHLHFYFLLGIIPLSLLVLYVNVFIGPPKLADIPEDYEPKYWEYYDHPIKQFLAKHFMESPQQVYEKRMHLLQAEHEKVQLRALQAKVQKLIAARGDYQAWYFVPYDSKYTKYYQEKAKEIDRYSKSV
uniref:NADH dehydrogenase [ubiquinone] 1 beta subcomplex subunit 5, mitochondrial n=1 Tax=Amblyomma tuberculatum TaxID=48802 RepID=A0A6M2E4B2_9ACAR